MHQRQITAHQALDVAQQLRFAAVLVKDRLAQPGLAALRQGEGRGLLSLELRGGLTAGLRQQSEQGLQLLLIRELIEADAESFGVRRRCTIRQHPQVETSRCGSAVYSLSLIHI